MLNIYIWCFKSAVLQSHFPVVSILSVHGCNGGKLNYIGLKVWFKTTESMQVSISKTRLHRLFLHFRTRDCKLGEIINVTQLYSMSLQKWMGKKIGFITEMWDICCECCGTRCPVKRVIWCGYCGLTHEQTACNQGLYKAVHGLIEEWLNILSLPAKSIVFLIHLLYFTLLDC